MNYSNSQDWIGSLQPITGRPRATISEEIYTSLKTAIMAGKIGPGQHLVELILADQFQVSRVAVREALRRLANDGVVEIVPNRGVFTIQLFRTDIESLTLCSAKNVRSSGSAAVRLSRGLGDSLNWRQLFRMSHLS